VIPEIEMGEQAVEHDDSPPLIGHITMDPAKRVALCGSTILGVKAAGAYVACLACSREWIRLQEAEKRGDWILLDHEESPS